MTVSTEKSTTASYPKPFSSGLPSIVIDTVLPSLVFTSLLNTEYSRDVSWPTWSILYATTTLTSAAGSAALRCISGQVTEYINLAAKIDLSTVSTEAKNKLDNAYHAVGWTGAFAGAFIGATLNYVAHTRAHKYSKPAPVEELERASPSQNKSLSAMRSNIIKADSWQQLAQMAREARSKPVQLGS